MWNEEKIRKYWQEQTKKGDNPCHYHNKWQDKYAFGVRTGAFKRKDFAGAQNIVDIGCGVGDYTNALSKLTEARFKGFDFPFNIEIAKKKHADNTKITFIPKSLPDEEVKTAIENADIVFTTTVYIHLSLGARVAFLEAASRMEDGKKVMLLEYMPDQIPEFQKSLPQKNIETPQEVIAKFKGKGFILKEMRHVNFIDSYFFFHLGKNWASYYLTLALESLLRLARYQKSKYKLLIFEKMA